VEAVQVEIVGERRTATRFRRGRFRALGTASADECGPAERRPIGNSGGGGVSSTGRARQRGVRTGHTAQRRVINACQTEVSESHGMQLLKHWRSL